MGRKGDVSLISRRAMSAHGAVGTGLICLDCHRSCSVTTSMAASLHRISLGAKSLDYIGIDNVMIETDYPHTDSTWPNSMATAHKQLDG